MTTCVNTPPAGANLDPIGCVTFAWVTGSATVAVQTEGVLGPGYIAAIWSLFVLSIRPKPTEDGTPANVPGEVASVMEVSRLVCSKWEFEVGKVLTVVQVCPFS